VSWPDLHPPYGTIVADPPWRYRRSGVAKSRYYGGHRGMAAEDHYATMTTAEIAALPVAELAAPDAHCYLWATAPRLFGDRYGDGPGPVDVLRAWGFAYVTTLVWHKQGAPGLGFYWRVDAEFCLFGVRGRAPIPAALRRSNVIAAPRAGHSVKPAAVADAVEVVSPGPYVELFARQPRLGWDSWGWGRAPVEVAG
jgi:N6-adenosine-specific RNA methylase IME4